MKEKSQAVHPIGRNKIQVFRESHLTPDWARERLTRAGGLNRFGEPNFRVVWGSNLCDWIGGKWEDRDQAGNLVREVRELRWELKYPWLKNRWIVERWLPPEKFGSVDDWFRRTKEWGEEGNLAQLGPYPSRGRFTFLCAIELGPGPGGFLQLTPATLDWVMEAYWLSRKRSETLAEKKEAERKRQLVRDIEDREFIADGTPAFYGEPTVSVL